MITFKTRSLKTVARLAGAALIAVPLAASAGAAHAATAQALVSLLPTGGFSAYARTANSVAISGDTAVVGSIGNNAAYVFVKANGAWTEQGRLADPSIGGGDEFGSAVAISGNTILVGDPGHVTTDSNGTPNQQTGAVFEFDRSGTTWMETATIGSSYSGDRLGAAVALDGNTAVLGAPGYQNNTGAAYLFNRFAPGQWQQQKVLLATEGQAMDQFGSSVSISGSTALVGAPYAAVLTKRADTGVINTAAGAAYVFIATGQPVKSGNAWAEQARLVSPAPASYAQFGTSVSVSGNQALVGAPFDKNDAGAAYVSTRSGAIWSAPVALPAPNTGMLDQVGTSVALSGNQALVGAYGAQAAYLFTLNGATWVQNAKLTQAGALGLGSAVALDGANAAIGAIYGNNYQGAAYATALESTSPPVPAPAPKNPAAMTINDTDAHIVYSGSAWGYYAGRPASFNDIDNDVHATLHNGDSVSYTFTGTAVSYISEKSAGYGKVAVYIDGRYWTTVNADSATARNMGGQVLYSKSGLSFGRHTIKLVKKSGVYMLLDAFKVQ